MHPLESLRALLHTLTQIKLQSAQKSTQILGLNLLVRLIVLENFVVLLKRLVAECFCFPLTPAMGEEIEEERNINLQEV